MSPNLYTPSSGYVRRRGVGQLWHVARSRAAATACGVFAPTAGWPQWAMQTPAAAVMCATCHELDPRRHGAERRAAVR